MMECVRNGTYDFILDSSYTVLICVILKLGRILIQRVCTEALTRIDTNTLRNLVFVVKNERSKSTIKPLY